MSRIPPRFEYMPSDDRQTLFAWARRIVDRLNSLNRLWELAEMDLTGKAGYTVKVRADENGFELVP